MPAFVVLAATDRELSHLSSMLRARPDRLLQDFPVSRAPGPSFDILLVTSGPGMANAAAACAAAIERFQPNRIFTAGICGVYGRDDALLGAAVAGTRAIFADTGAAGERGFTGLREMGLALSCSAGANIFNSLELDDSPAPPEIARAEFLTVACVSGCPEQADALRARYPGHPDALLCEDMESAAVALAARRAGIPCTVVRGISNLCGIRDRREWKIGGAADAAQETLFSILQQWTGH